MVAVVEEVEEVEAAAEAVEAAEAEVVVEVVVGGRWRRMAVAGRRRWRSRRGRWGNGRWRRCAGRSLHDGALARLYLLVVEVVRDSSGVGFSRGAHRPDSSSCPPRSSG